MTSTLLDWSAIVRIEPKLRQIEADALTAFRSGGDPWKKYETLKRRAQKLAGWDAAKPELQTGAAYEVVLDRIVRALETGR